MEQSIDKQESEVNQSVTHSQPVVNLAQRVSEWTRYFFTLTQKEKDAAGICDYKKEHH